MSDEYIEKEDAINIINEWWGDDSSIAQWLAKKIKKAPPADVAPVRHGRWKHERLPSTSGGSYAVAVVRCSVCGYQYPMAETHFCPNCGARMDGEEDD